MRRPKPSSPTFFMTMLLSTLLLMPPSIGSVSAGSLLFHDDFENGLGKWDEFCDASISGNGLNSNHSTRLALREFRAQYLVHEVRAEEQPDWSFVYGFHVKLHRFSGEAVTLAALVFPTGKMSVVVSRGGSVGLAFNLFEEPVLSNHRLRMEEWEKIQLYVDYDSGKVGLYLNDVKVLEDDLRGRNLPLLKIWIGVIWMGGGGGYGMMMEGYFDGVALGGKDLLTPKTPIPAFTITVLACAVAASIIVLTLIIKRARRKIKR